MRKVVSLAAAVAVAATALTVPAAARAADAATDAGALAVLIETLAASEAAYSDGIVSRVEAYQSDGTPVPTFASALSALAGSPADAPVVEYQEVGVSGSGLYGESPRVSGAWRVDTGSPEVVFARTDTDALAMYQPLGEFWSGYRPPKRVRDAVVADLVERGGSVDSLVRADRDPGDDFDELAEVEWLLEQASPATAVRDLLELFPSDDVSVSVGAPGSDLAFVIAVESYEWSTDDVPLQATVEVFVDPAGVVVSTVTEVRLGIEEFLSTTAVTAYGSSVVLPGEFSDRVDSRLANRALQYVFTSQMLRFDLQAVARVARKLARLEDRPVSKRYVYLALGLAGFFDEAWPSAPRVRPIEQGYRVVDRSVPGVSAFGPLCFTVTATARNRVAVQGC